MRRPTLPLVLAAVAALAFGGCASTSAGTWTYPPATSHAARPTRPPSADASAAPESAASPAAAVAQALLPPPAPSPRARCSGRSRSTAVDLGLRAHRNSRSTSRAATRSTLTNTGSIPHDITFPDGTTGVAKPGETGTVNVDVPDAASPSSARSPAMPMPA